MKTTNTLVLLSSLLVSFLGGSANAHGFVVGFRVDGQWNAGYDPNCSDHPDRCNTTAAWPNNNKKWAPMLPKDYASPSIICNMNASPAPRTVQAPAGATIDLLWNTWPKGHTGPIITALASCGGSCSTVDEKTLAFAPFDQKGIESGSNPGTWATDTMITNNKTYSVHLPASLKAGEYVLRTEIIALFAAKGTGAQNYPQCINLKVTGGGNDVPVGKPAMEWYTPQDPGIYVDIYRDHLTRESYKMPGPALWVPLASSGGDTGGAKNIASVPASAPSTAPSSPVSVAPTPQSADATKTPCSEHQAAQPQATGQANSHASGTTDQPSGKPLPPFTTKADLMMWLSSAIGKQDSDLLN